MKDFERIAWPLGIPIPDSSILFPPAAAVGWIPYIKCGQTAPVEFSGYGRKIFRDTAATMLFRTGNRTGGQGVANPAVPRLRGRGQFLNLVASKNFRAAVAIDDVRVWEHNGRLCVSCCVFGVPGYTAVRGWTDRVLHFDRGRGDSDVSIETGSDEVRISAWVAFKIGKIGDLGCYFFTGRFAPSCRLTIDYRIHRDGSYFIEFGGTSIPSQSHYVGWNRRGSHDMLGASRHDFDEFFRTQACTNAPQTGRYSLTEAQKSSLK